MPRIRPPHLVRETTRHGTIKWYFRRFPGARIRLHGEFGSPEFQSAYEAALMGKGPKIDKPASASQGSLQWLYDQYRESDDWRNKKPATRRQQEQILAGVMMTNGAGAFTMLKRKDIEAGKDRRRGTPSQARNFLKAMGGMFGWALDAGYVTVDPTANVKYPPKAKGGGFPIWEEEDVLAYEARWPIGTRQRVWLAVLMFTGLRRGDAARLGRQHVRKGVATIKTEKSNFTVEVAIPILPVLADVLAAGPCGDLSYICGAHGKPFTKESFGNEFRQACRAAGVNKSAHGLRKIAATRAAENGATVAELNAIFGWVGSAMASLYTQNADRKRLAGGAMSKLVLRS